MNRRARLTLLLALALTACQSAKDTTPPALLGSTPADGAEGVATDSPLSLAFSEPMDQASVQLAATPATALGAGTWTSASTVRFTPVSGWQAGSSYAVAVSGADLAGNALPDTTLTFATAAPPDTTAPAPPANVQAAAGDGAFTLSWDAGSEDDLAGVTVYWGETAGALGSALFVPAPGTEATVGDLENGATYAYALEAEDLAGNRSARVSGSVTPRDATAPQLLSSEPADGASDLTLVPALRFTFSEPMDTSSLEFGLCLSDDPPEAATCPDPTPVNFGAPSWSEGDTRAQLTPTDQLQGGKTHVLVIEASDKGGNALAPPATVAFSLRATPDTTAPTVESHDVEIDEVKGSGQIVLAFSEPMDQASVEVALLSQPALSCAWTWEASAATCRITSGLEQLTSYTLALSVAARDTAGNPLAAPYPFGFDSGNFSPRLASVLPRNGDFEVDLTTPIVFTFSEPMNQESVQNALSVRVGDAAVPGALEWDSGGTTLTFKPQSGYGNGRTVVWTIGTGAREASVGRTLGKPLAAAVSGSFTTRLVFAP